MIHDREREYNLIELLSKLGIKSAEEFARSTPDFYLRKFLRAITDIKNLDIKDLESGSVFNAFMKSSK